MDGLDPSVTARRSASAASRPLSIAFIVLALLFSAAALAAAVLDIDSDDGGERDPVAALLAEVTDPGDRLGVVGRQSAAFLPDGRTPVRLDASSAPEDAPRFILVSATTATSPVPALEEGAAVLLELERPSGVIRILDRRTGDAPSASTPDDLDDDSRAPPGPSEDPEPSNDPDRADDAAGVPSSPSAGDEPRELAMPSGDVTDARPAAHRSVTITVETGDNFWDLAEERLRASGNDDPTTAEVLTYWQLVLDANADELVEPGNPDLILVGQQLVLPPVP